MWCCSLGMSATGNRGIEHSTAMFCRWHHCTVTCWGESLACCHSHAAYLSCSCGLVTVGVHISPSSQGEQRHSHVVLHLSGTPKAPEEQHNWTVSICSLSPFPAPKEGWVHPCHTVLWKRTVTQASRRVGLPCCHAALVGCLEHLQISVISAGTGHSFVSYWGQP